MNKRAFLTLHTKPSDSQESLKTRRVLLRPLTKTQALMTSMSTVPPVRFVLGSGLKGWTPQLGTVLAEKRNITDALRDGG